jgi:hypothetical protein
MTKKNKNIIFYALLALFLIGGTATVFYAQGWRISFENFKISKVGGIYIKSFPNDAQIFINKKPVKNTSTFFTAGTFISDLFPKIYSVELKENGYQKWQENAYVEPSKVFQLSSAVLIPQNATTVEQGPIFNFSIKNKILITQNDNKSININNIKTIKNSDFVTQSKDGNSIIIYSLGKYILYQIQNETSINLNTIFAKNKISATNITNINFDDQNPSIIIVEEKNKIYLVNTQTTKITQIENNKTNSEILNTNVKYNSIVWANSGTSSTIIYLYDKSSKKMSSSSPIFGKNIQLEWIKDGFLGIAQNDGKLYTYDTNSKAINKIADDVKYFKPNGDGSLISTLESKSIEIIPTDGSIENYYRFNIPEIENTKSIIWYQDSMHIFVQYNNYVSFLDFKDLSLKNFVKVSDGTSPIYSKEQNALYILDPAENLIRFDFPS